MRPYYSKSNIATKIVSLITISSFLISNISYAAPYSAKNSALRTPSSAVSGADRGIIASFGFSTGPVVVDALDDGTLEDILRRQLEKAGLEEGRDVAVEWKSSRFGSEDVINIATLFPPNYIGDEKRAPNEYDKWLLRVHNDFHADYEDILRNDVILRVNFGDGVTRNISVARGLAYRAFGGEFQWRKKLGGHLRKPETATEIDVVEDEQEASKVGIRYQIINSAIWIWYHYLYKNLNQKARQDNRFATAVIDRFFEIVNNPATALVEADYIKEVPEKEERIKEIQTVIKFRRQIPFLLGNEQLQKQVKEIILLANGAIIENKRSAEVDLSGLPDGDVKKPDIATGQRIIPADADKPDLDAIARVCNTQKKDINAVEQAGGYTFVQLKWYKKLIVLGPGYKTINPNIDTIGGFSVSSYAGSVYLFAINGNKELTLYRVGANRTTLLLSISGASSADGQAVTVTPSGRYVICRLGEPDTDIYDAVVFDLEKQRVALRKDNVKGIAISPGEKHILFKTSKYFHPYRLHSLKTGKEVLKFKSLPVFSKTGEFILEKDGSNSTIYSLVADELNVCNPIATLPEEVVSVVDFTSVKWVETRHIGDGIFETRMTAELLDGTKLTYVYKYKSEIRLAPTAEEGASSLALPIVEKQVVGFSVEKVERPAIKDEIKDNLDALLQTWGVDTTGCYKDIKVNSKDYTFIHFRKKGKLLILNKDKGIISQNLDCKELWLHPDGEHLVAVDSSRTARIFKLADNVIEHIYIVPGECSGGFLDVSFSAKGQYAVINTFTSRVTEKQFGKGTADITVYDLKNRKVALQETGLYVEFSPDENSVLVKKDSGILRPPYLVYDLKTRELVLRLREVYNFTQDKSYFVATPTLTNTPALYSHRTYSLLFPFLYSDIAKITYKGSNVTVEYSEPGHKAETRVLPHVVEKSSSLKTPLSANAGAKAPGDLGAGEVGLDAIAKACGVAVSEIDDARGVIGVGGYSFVPLRDKRLLILTPENELCYGVGSIDVTFGWFVNKYAGNLYIYTIDKNCIPRIYQLRKGLTALQLLYTHDEPCHIPADELGDFMWKPIFSPSGRYVVVKYGRHENKAASTRSFNIAVYDLQKERIILVTEKVVDVLFSPREGYAVVESMAAAKGLPRYRLHSLTTGDEILKLEYQPIFGKTDEFLLTKEPDGKLAIREKILIDFRLEETYPIVANLSDEVASIIDFNSVTNVSTIKDDKSPTGFSAYIETVLLDGTKVTYRCQIEPSIQEIVGPAEILNFSRPEKPELSREADLNTLLASWGIPQESIITQGTNSSNYTFVHVLDPNFPFRLNDKLLILNPNRQIVAQLHMYNWWDLLISPDGEHILFRDRFNKFRLLKLGPDTATLVSTCDIAYHYAISYKFSSTGRYIIFHEAGLSLPNTILYDVIEKRIALTLTTKTTDATLKTTDVTFSPDETYAVFTTSYPLRPYGLFHLETGKAVTWSRNKPVFNEDGKFVYFERTWPINPAVYRLEGDKLKFVFAIGPIDRWEDSVRHRYPVKKVLEFTSKYIIVEYENGEAEGTDLDGIMHFVPSRQTPAAKKQDDVAADAARRETGQQPPQANAGAKKASGATTAARVDPDEVILRRAAPEDIIYGYEKSPDGAFFVLKGKRIKVYNLNTNELVLDIKNKFGGNVEFSPRGGFLICELRKPSRNKKWLTVFDLKNPRKTRFSANHPVIKNKKAHGGYKVSPRDECIAAIDEWDNANAWDIKTGAQVLKNQDAFYGCEFSADSPEGTYEVRVTSKFGQTWGQVFKVNQKDPVRGVAYGLTQHPSFGKSHDEWLDEICRHLKIRPRDINKSRTVAFKGYVALYTCDDNVSVIRPGTKDNPTRYIVENMDARVASGFTKDGKYFIRIDRHCYLTVYNLGLDTPESRVLGYPNVHGYVVSPNCKSIVTGNYDNRNLLTAHNLITGHRSGSLDATNGFEFSPDGKLLLTRDSDFKATMINCATLEFVFTDMPANYGWRFKPDSTEVTLYDKQRGKNVRAKTILCSRSAAKQSTAKSSASNTPEEESEDSDLDTSDSVVDGYDDEAPDSVGLSEIEKSSAPSTPDNAEKLEQIQKFLSQPRIFFGLISLEKLSYEKAKEIVQVLINAQKQGALIVPEIALRGTEEQVQDALRLIRDIRASDHDAIIATGSVSDPENSKAAVLAGANIVITPGFVLGREDIEYIRAAGCEAVLGIGSEEEALKAKEIGLKYPKAFPLKINVKPDQTIEDALIDTIKGPLPDKYRSFLSRVKISKTAGEKYATYANVLEFVKTEPQEDKVFMMPPWGDELIKIIQGVFTAVAATVTGGATTEDVKHFCSIDSTDNLNVAKSITTLPEAQEMAEFLIAEHAAKLAKMDHSPDDRYALLSLLEQEIGESPLSQAHKNLLLRALESGKITTSKGVRAIIKTAREILARDIFKQNNEPAHILIERYIREQLSPEAPAQPMDINFILEAMKDFYTYDTIINSTYLRERVKVLKMLASGEITPDKIKEVIETIEKISSAEGFKQYPRGVTDLIVRYLQGEFALVSQAPLVDVDEIVRVAQRISVSLAADSAEPLLYNLALGTKTPAQVEAEIAEQRSNQSQQADDGTGKPPAKTSASNTPKEGAISVNGAAKITAGLGAAEDWQQRFNEAIEKALRLSNEVILPRQQQILTEFLEQVDRSRQIVITVPDVYIFNPGLKEFAESVKDKTTISGQPLFQFVVSIDSSLPDSGILAGLAPQVSKEAIIAAKRKTIEAWGIPGLQIKELSCPSQAEKPVEAAQELIEQLGITNGKATERPILIIFQHPVVKEDSNIAKRLTSLAKAKNAVIVVPTAERKNQVFNVLVLLNTFLSQSFSGNGAGVYSMQLPKAESLEVRQKINKFYRTLLRAFECA